MAIYIGFPLYETDVRNTKWQDQGMPRPGTADYMDWYDFSRTSTLFPSGLQGANMDGVSFHHIDKSIVVVGFKIEQQQDLCEEKGKRTSKELQALVGDFDSRVTRFMKQQGLSHVRQVYRVDPILSRRRRVALHER